MSLPIFKLIAHMIQHNTTFTLGSDTYRYSAEEIQAYKNNNTISLNEFVVAYKEYKDRTAQAVNENGSVSDLVGYENLPEATY